MSSNKPVSLRSLPLVRRLEYLLVFLEGVRDKLHRNELAATLGQKKRAFEIEKDLALGRGNPHRKDITQAVVLLKHCIRLTRDLKFINKAGLNYRLAELGKKYLESDEFSRKRIFAEAFSQVYPHLTVLVSALSSVENTDMILPLKNKPEFEPESRKYGFTTYQMYFDTTRDIATNLGLVNWCVKGTGFERRQHVYLVCKIIANEPNSFLLKLKDGRNWLYAVPYEVDRKSFRESLWGAYLALVDGVPGSPIFYSSVREQVCAILKLRDDQFDDEIMKMVDSDDILQVIWSEGVLQYQKDSASMLKSLPPKNEWGRYVVYLKIIRR